MDPIDPRKKTEMKNISPSLSISPVSHISLYSPYFISLDLSGGSGSGAGVRRAAASTAGPAGAHRRGGGLKLPSSLPPSLRFLPPSLPGRGPASRRSARSGRGLASRRRRAARRVRGPASRGQAQGVGDGLPSSSPLGGASTAAGSPPPRCHETVIRRIQQPDTYQDAYPFFFNLIKIGYLLDTYRTHIGYVSDTYPIRDTRVQPSIRAT